MINFNLEYLSNRLVCTEDEKEECVEIANRIVFLCCRIVSEGLWSDYLKKELEKDYYKENIPLMKKGMELILNTIEPSILEKILYNYIYIGNYKGKEFLKNLIIFETLMCIQEWLTTGIGLNVYIIKKLICSLFGKDIDFSLLDHLSEIYLNTN